ncbi:MAG: Gfo/Idh/MocA family protein [Planctomycetota bacterium]|jgi:predicted dehydrogenase
METGSAGRTTIMIRVGIVGFGFMGRIHHRCWQQLQGSEVTAICDAKADIVEETNRAVGNIETAAETASLAKMQAYRDFDEMLSGQKLDAVSIALPTYLHAEFSIKALQTGMHVLCEKPMALNVADCQRMIEAAKSSGKVLQIGQCLRFWPEYTKAKEIVDSGEDGEVIAATFQRLGSAPDWAADNWFMDEEQSGGMAMDLHIHDTDFVQHLFGMPRAVSSFGAKDPAGRLVHIVTQYLYGDEKTVTAEGGWALMPSFGFEMSFNIVLAKATLVYDCTREPKLRVCPEQGDVFVPDLEETDGYSLEIAHFARAISGENVQPVTTLEQSRDSVRIVEAEKESATTGKPVAL